jgi:hypothetical protein
MSTNHFARFRFNLIERSLPILIILCTAWFAWLIRHKFETVTFFAVLFILYWIYRLFISWAFYFIVFNENGIVIRRGVLFIPQHLRFEQITNIRTIQPDKHIHFQIDMKHEVRLAVSRLEKKDRIRFIFLIESDVNRLAINAGK